MKRKVLFFTYLLLINLVAIGCAPTESNEEVQEENSSIVKEAIDKGKLALADADIEKAKSNFNLALMEDSENIEAIQWVEIIEKYDQFLSAVGKKETDKAIEILDELKGNEKYALMEGLTKEPEEKLNESIAKIKEIDTKIAELSNLYNPEDENSMPDETYLVRIDEVLRDPNLTEDQKKSVEEFEKKATKRVNAILAREEEKMKAAEKEAQAHYNPYEWNPGVKEQFESEMVESGYADSIETIRYEEADIYNNQGHYEVYAEMDGVEYRIVNVNVKTGDYHG